MGLDLRATLALDGSGFEAGVRRAQRVAAGLSGTLNGSLKGAIAGAFSVGAISVLTKKTLDYAGHLNDLADRLGVSTDFLQEFQYVAKQTGTDVDALTTFIEKLNTARMEALSGKGGAKMRAQFGAFGISEGDLKSQRAEDLISKKIAVAFEHTDPQKLIGPLRNIAGKAGGEMIPAFVAGFNAMRTKAHEAGQVMSEDIIQQLDDIGDQFAILTSSLVVEWGQAIIKMIGWIRELKNVIGQSGSGAGAATAYWKPADYMAATGFGLVGIIGRLLGGKLKPLLLDEAALAINDDDEKFKKKLKGEEDARDRAKAARKKRQAPTPEGFTAPDVRHSMPEDSLVRVGNFLGSSSSTIAAIGERTNSLLKTISTQMGTLITNTGGGGSIFPPNP